MPQNTSVWVRYDADARRYRASLPNGGPDWRDVVRRVTLDVDTWEELDDLSKPYHADHERIFAFVPGGPRNIVTLLFYRDYGEPPTDVNTRDLITEQCAAAEEEVYLDPVSYYTPARPDVMTTDAAPAEEPQGIGGHPPDPYVPGPKKKVHVMTYDMGDFFPIVRCSVRRAYRY